MATQLDPKQLDKLTVSALKAELSARGLLTDGLKNVLVNRLREVLPPAEEEEAHALPQEAPTLPVRDDETPSVQVSLQPTEEEPSSSSLSSSSASSFVGASSPSSTVENGTSRKRSHPEGSERPSKRGCLMTLLPPDLSDQEIRSFQHESDAINAKKTSTGQKWDGRAQPIKLFDRSETSIRDQIDAIENGTAPPPRWPATCPDVAESDWTPVVHLENFRRPVNVAKLRELLANTGSVVEFWMDAIKSHCFVQYATAAEAQETRRALFAVRWPNPSSSALYSSFSAIDALRAAAEQQPSAVDADDAKKPRNAEEARRDPLPRRPTVPLSDLYKITNTQPHIYWRPVHFAPPPPRSTSPRRSEPTRRR